MVCMAACFGLFAACTPTDIQETSDPVCIYPDYQGVTIPCNIAPLNFMLRKECKALEVTIKAENNGQEILKINEKGNKVIFGIKAWKELLAKHIGQQLHVSVTALHEDEESWVRYPDFTWNITADSLDSYLTYRLIEPGYEVWDKVCIEERNTETFDTRILANGSDLGNRCMNCHTHGGAQGQYSFLHLRGEQGGTLLNRDGQLRKVSLKKEGMASGAVYGDWHPSGRYGVFSTNVIIPAFHSLGSRRLEVYDTTSDLCVADFDRDTLLLPPLASGTDDVLETFPAFSADGQWIYYCSAPNPCGDTVPAASSLVKHIDELHYSLCRIHFDAETGSFGEAADTLYNARTEGLSANFPKCSPDGRYLAFCLSQSGTFPIWHQETRLNLIKQVEDRQDAECIELKNTHATYHSWSHNSKWLAFASKGYDGQYSRISFVHIDDANPNDIRLSRPFVLPQADPEMDDWNLRSFNIPDLSTQQAPFGHKEVKILLEKVKTEPFK